MDRLMTDSDEALPCPTDDDGQPYRVVKSKHTPTWQVLRIPRGWVATFAHEWDARLFADARLRHDAFVTRMTNKGKA